MKYFDIVILGGGASGCMAGIVASEKNKSIAIIDKANKIAKKILVTGNGRCNLTNTNMSSGFFNQNIDKFLDKFNQNDTLSFFEKLGLETYSDEEGRVYPLSNSAKSVVSVITNKIENSQIQTFVENEILSIKKEGNKFTIVTDKEAFECKKLVFALGGNLLSQIENNFSLAIKPYSPSLVSLKIKCSKFLANTKVSNVQVTAKNAKNQTLSERGEILFRENGISGICVFNLSTIFSRINDFNGTITIDLLPNLTKEELYQKLLQRKNLNVKINKFFDGLFSSPIGYEILNRCNLDEEKSVATLTNDVIGKMVLLIKNLDFKVCGNLENNQVYSGGISLESLDTTLQSKKIENLHFCGEACDVDGVCGGYNLQWAWTSGFIVGESI